jgi:putative ABC transport system permease protein
MYPELVGPLVVALAGCLTVVLFLLLARPVLRRLAGRQLARRPADALIVVSGALLGTALIVASLVVGDSLDRSVRQAAHDVLGPVDQMARAASISQGDEAERRLSALESSPLVDGVLTVRHDLAAVTRGTGQRVRAEPRAIAFEVDFRAAAGFGGPHPSGLDVEDPGPGGVVINSNLAGELRAEVGDRVDVYLYGRPHAFRVTAVVPSTGVAGMGLGAAQNNNAFVTEGVVQSAALAAGSEPTTTVLVSNRGDVEAGAELSDRVTGAMTDALGGLEAHGVVVTQPKVEVLDNAERTSAQLGSLFLFIASFAIIAGVLLLVNVFVMLADERRGQLGMLRAIGMRRRRVTGEFALEGAAYAAVAAALGAAVGLLVGRVIVVLAVNILNNFSRDDNQLTLVFDVRWQSLFNGMASGFVLAFVAVVLTSVRIARGNIIAAIRDLPAAVGRTPRRRSTVASVAATVLFSAAAVPAIAANNGALTYLLPALAATAAVPWASRFFRPRTVVTVVALFVLGWGLVAHLVRPHIYDEASNAPYIVMGTMLSFAAVVLVTQHQRLLLRPLRPAVDRPGEGGLAVRLAVTYPTARPFRTGATLAMYCMVVMVIVLLAQISALIHAGVRTAVTDASAGWTLRADFNPSTPLPDPALVGSYRQGDVTGVVPLVAAAGYGTDPLDRWTQPLPVLAVGYSGELVDPHPALQDRLASLPDDDAAWRLPITNPSYVLVDQFYGAPGGPPGKPLEPAMVIKVTDPRSGAVSTRIIAGILEDGTAFYGTSAGEPRFPILMSNFSVRTTFGADAKLASMLLRTSPGANRASLVNELQAGFLSNSLVVTDIPAAVRNTYAANTQMFRLMQGYLAMGLVVAISGLGVVMVRSVRERRRSIGVLRALGLRARALRRAMLIESTFIALEGVAIGTALGLLTTWLLFQNSPAFAGLDASYPVAWAEISVTVGLALVGSFLATAVPARRAAAVRPALAVRVPD